MKKAIFYILATLIAVSGYAVAYYYYDQYNKTKTLLENPSEITKAEVQSVIEKLSKLIELPQEEPSIATVLDKEKVAKDPFFEKAENGDKLVVFSNSKLAIIYRPSQNKIINIAPLVVDQNGQEVPVASPNPKDN